MGEYYGSKGVDTWRKKEWEADIAEHEVTFPFCSSDIAGVQSDFMLCRRILDTLIKVLKASIWRSLSSFFFILSNLLKICF